MEILFLGTSSGATDLHRFHSSLLLKNKERNILIDAGDSVSRALMQQNIGFGSITDIIISHHHSDHLAGLPSLLTQMKIGNRKKSLTIYSHVDLSESLKKFLEISYVFIEKLPFRTDLVDFSFDSKVMLTENLDFSAKQNFHIVNKEEVSNTDINFISSSFLFMIKNKRIIYTSDVATADELKLFSINKNDIMITEASHISYSELEDLVKRASPKCVYLTHFNDEVSIKRWRKKLTSKLKMKIFIAYDGLIIKL